VQKEEVLCMMLLGYDAPHGEVWQSLSTDRKLHSQLSKGVFLA